MAGNAPQPQEIKPGNFSVVTGAFGYSGRFIARELRARGIAVKTLVSHRHLVPAATDSIAVEPLDFLSAEALAERIRGADVFYNTYWVRFNRGRTSFDTAVKNTGILIEALRLSGVRRLVHLSVTNPESGSNLPYFAGKAAIESMIRDSGLSYAIVRPALIFGPGDILVNNLAWLLRRFPIFAIPGSGTYRMQPIYAADLARQCVDLAGCTENLIVDSLGDEVLTFKEAICLIRDAVGSRARLVHVQPSLAVSLCGLLSLLVGDVLLTEDELKGLMQDLLVSTGPTCGTTRFSTWIVENASALGTEYHSELARHFPR